MTSNGNIFRVTGPLCGELPVTGEFPSQRPVTRKFCVFFDLRLNKRLSKQSLSWWFETSSHSLWRHCNGVNIIYGIGTGVTSDVNEPPTTLVLSMWSRAVQIISGCIHSLYVMFAFSRLLGTWHGTFVRRKPLTCGDRVNLNMLYTCACVVCA